MNWNLFRTPDFFNRPDQFPWYVSHGYLIFVPDIHYRIGHPGPSAFNAIVSAARYLSTMPWVDAKRIGLAGHSFGGYETDYLVTHTGFLPPPYQLRRG